MLEDNMKNRKKDMEEASVTWGRFGQSSTAGAYDKKRGEDLYLSPISSVAMCMAIFKLVLTMRRGNMEMARNEAARLRKIGCKDDRPVLIGMVAEYSARIEVHFENYDFAEGLLLDIALPSYSHLPDHFSNQSKRTLDFIKTCREEKRQGKV